MTAPATTPEDPRRGILLRLLSGLLSAAMVVTVKLLSEAVPLGQIVFFRSAFALIPLAVFLLLRHELPGGLRSSRPWGHLLRSGFGVLSMFAAFAAIARLPLAEVTLIGYLSPVLTSMAGVALLGERLTVFRIGGVSLGLAGVAVLVWPELGGGPMDERRLLGLGLAVLNAVLGALALTMVRSLARSGESPGAIAFYFALASALAGLATLPGGWITPSAQTLALLVLAGVFGGFAHIAMTLAFRHAEASRLAPFEYLALIWAVLADLLIFGLPLGPAFLIALPLVLGGALCAALERGPRKTVPT